MLEEFLSIDVLTLSYQEFFWTCETFEDNFGIQGPT